MCSITSVGCNTTHSLNHCCKLQILYTLGKTLAPFASPPMVNIAIQLPSMTMERAEISGVPNKSLSRQPLLALHSLAAPFIHNADRININCLLNFNFF